MIEQGRAGEHAGYWTSGDITGMPPGTQVHRVLYASGHWFAVGGYAKAGAFYDSLPLVLTSQDGTHWMRMDSSGMGTGNIAAATVDSAGHPGPGRLGPPAEVRAELPHGVVQFRLGWRWDDHGLATRRPRLQRGSPERGGHSHGRACADRGQPGPLALSKPVAGARSQVLISSRGG